MYTTQQHLVPAMLLLPESSIIVRTATNNFLTATSINPADYCHHYSSVEDNIIATSISIMPSSSSTTATATTVVPLAVAAAAVIATTSIATIIGLIGGYYYRSITSINDRELKTLKVPKHLLQSEYKDELKLAIQLAMEGKCILIYLHLLLLTLIPLYLNYLHTSFFFFFLLSSVDYFIPSKM